VLKVSAMGPLRGLRVLEFEAIGPVPWAAMMLADMGADVLRIARPAPADMGIARDLRHETVLRGRRSVTANLKDTAARDAVLALTQNAHVLLEGNRPGRPRHAARADLDGENGVPRPGPQQASPPTDFLFALWRPARSADRHEATRGGPPRPKKNRPSPARCWTVTAQACAAREIDRLPHAVGHAGSEAPRQQPPGLRIGSLGQRGESATAAWIVHAMAKFAMAR
jgi:hypothetical protein